jgi:hypothetical protein
VEVEAEAEAGRSPTGERPAEDAEEADEAVELEALPAGVNVSMTSTRSRLEKAFPATPWHCSFHWLCSTKACTGGSYFSARNSTGLWLLSCGCFFFFFSSPANRTCH